MKYEVPVSKCNCRWVFWPVLEFEVDHLTSSISIIIIPIVLCIGHFPELHYGIQELTFQSPGYIQRKGEILYNIMMANFSFPG